MKIASAASAFPKHYSQKFLLEKLQEYWGDQLRRDDDEAQAAEHTRGISEHDE